MRDVIGGFIEKTGWIEQGTADLAGCSSETKGG